MRCSCPECDTYMVHSESMRLGCVCPQCGARCSACLGTDSVVSRDALHIMKEFDWITPSFDEERNPERALPDDPVSREEDENPGRHAW